LKIECENDEQEIEINGLEMKSDMKDIFREIRAKIEFECIKADLYIITDDVTPIHENQSKDYTLEHFGINRFTHLKFSIKFISLWFPAPENSPKYITLGE
jgi:hypothetical protein